MTNGKVLATPARPSFAKAKFTKSHSHEKPCAFRVERREAPGSWATPRERMLPPAHASGVARATEDPLARTACFGRAAPPGAPPPSRFSAAAVDRRCLRAAFRSCQPESPAGVLTERIDWLCNGKRDVVSRIIFPIISFTTQPQYVVVSRRGGLGHEPYSPRWRARPQTGLPVVCGGRYSRGRFRTRPALAVVPIRGENGLPQF